MNVDNLAGPYPPNIVPLAAQPEAQPQPEPVVTLTDGLPAILARIRALEADHAPDGWPEVQMRDLTAMRDEIMHLLAALEQAWSALDDLKAQPQPEPVVWVKYRKEGGFWSECNREDRSEVPVFFSPPAPTTPLTDEDIDAIPFDGFTDIDSHNYSEAECLRRFARAVLAAQAKSPGAGSAPDDPSAQPRLP